MPVYSFVCYDDNCSGRQDIYRAMKDASKPVKCPVCSQKMVQDYSPNAVTTWKKPKICEASGCHKKQVPAERELVKRHGLRGVEVLDCGRMKYASERAERSYLKLYHMHNKDGGG